MPTYAVKLRGLTQLGEWPLTNEELAKAQDLAEKTSDVASPQEAARQALDQASNSTSVMLVYVRGEGDDVTVFWPSGDPLTYSRQAAAGTSEGWCFVQATSECEGRGAPAGETAVFVADAPAMESGWVCDSCAGVVAPGL